MSDYGNPDYWDERYLKNSEQMFDWLESYNSLKYLIRECEPDKTARVLVLGCGNAEFSEDMYADGYINLVNIDISPVVIEQMQKRNENSTMEYTVMDVRELKYPDNSFDFVVDKSTLDALLCGELSFTNSAIMLKEVQRVLKPNRYYMCISYGLPENRVLHFERPHLAFEVRQEHVGDIEDPNDVNYVYICKKLEGSDDAVDENYERTLEELRTEDRANLV